MKVNSHVIGNCMRKFFQAILLLGAVAGLSSDTVAQSGEPPREPILRIETGMHTAIIWRIGVDAANRYLVTASEDKTVRVWELPSGLLLRIIRVPIGAGNEGKLFAVAISPDGSTIAAGGQTSTDGLHESIYFFDRESGRLIRRLGGLPRVVSQYQNPSYSLKFAAKDAKDFAAATATQKGFLYRDVVVKVLTDDQATKDNVLDGLDWIRKETTSKDVAMVFFAGHGLNDQNGVYYFLPYNTDLEKFLRTGVPFTDIKNTVQSLAGKTLFFIDTCHSGNVLGGRRGLADDLNGIINELSSAESGAVVFAASTGNQYSLEDAKWNNGAFTKALVEGITGRADYTGKGRITINMLDLYISERVKELTGGKQTPTTAKPNTIQDFPIAVKH